MAVELDNLHNKISLDALADVSGLSPSYISKLFHSETGITIAQYIQNKRIDAAKNLLIFTEYTTTDIANYLNFSSESYFINVLKTYIHHLTDRGYQNRTVALMENGSWAPVANKVMAKMLEGSKNLTFTQNNVKILSALSDDSRAQIEALAEELAN